MMTILSNGNGKLPACTYFRGLHDDHNLHQSSQGIFKSHLPFTLIVIVVFTVSKPSKMAGPLLLHTGVVF